MYVSFIFPQVCVVTVGRFALLCCNSLRSLPPSLSLTHSDKDKDREPVSNQTDDAYRRGREREIERERQRKRERHTRSIRYHHYHHQSVCCNHQRRRRPTASSPSSSFLGPSPDCTHSCLFCAFLFEISASPPLRLSLGPGRRLRLQLLLLLQNPIQVHPPHSPPPARLFAVSPPPSPSLTPPSHDTCYLLHTYISATDIISLSPPPLLSALLLTGQ